MAKRNTKFQPGQSGNPGGRPSGGGLRALLKATYGEQPEQLVTWLHEIARDKKHHKRLDAIKLLLAYHSGQPVQPLEHAGELAHTVKVVVHDYR